MTDRFPLEGVVSREPCALTGTFGTLEVPGVPVLVTVEPAAPIPVGRYPFTRFLSPHFGVIVWRSDSVPGHTGIEIHPGNWYTDTRDCLVVGMRKGVLARPGSSTPIPAVLSSLVAFHLLMDATANASTLWLTYQWASSELPPLPPPFSSAGVPSR